MANQEKNASSAFVGKMPSFVDTNPLPFDSGWRVSRVVVVLLL